MKIPVTMKWVPAKDEWHMLLSNGKLIYNFLDCDNVNRLFENPSKVQDEVFVVDISRLSRGTSHG